MEKEPAKDEAEEASELVDEETASPKRRWKVLRIFLTLFLTIPFYLAISLIGFCGGVGWYYLEESLVFDLSEVESLETGARVFDSQGTQIGRLGARNRIFIKRDEIPDHFLDALIAAEDQRYELHPGFDPIGTLRAAWANYRAESIQEGGSTLTQQLARNVFKLEKRNAERKLLEIAVAVRIEAAYSKDEILVHYLNRIYFGSGFYGLGAAAKGYFGKSVSELTIDESALICGLIRSPSRFSPFVSEERAMSGRDRTLVRMHAIERISASDLETLIQTETTISDSREDQINRGQRSFLLGRIEREVKQKFPDAHLEDAEIHTSVNLEKQQESAFVLDRHLEKWLPSSRAEEAKSNLEAAFVLIDNETGQIVASVGSRDFIRSEYDRSLEMKRPTGSAFFPFVYAAAFESGRITPQMEVLDAPVDNRQIMLGGVSGILGEWSSENPENRWQGMIPATDALKYSKNSPTARVGQATGLKRLAATTVDFGIASPLRDLSGSFLGASEMTLTEVTRAYSAFGRAGKQANPPAMVQRVILADGKELTTNESKKATPFLSRETIRAVVGSLDSFVKEDGGVARGKTGTTANYTDAWDFGFDETFTWGVWVGKDSFERIFPRAFGRKLARPIALEIMGLQERKEKENPDPVAPEKEGPPSPVPSFTQARVPVVSGDDPYGSLETRN